MANRDVVLAALLVVGCSFLAWGGCAEGEAISCDDPGDCPGNLTCRNSVCVNPDQILAPPGSNPDMTSVVIPDQPASPTDGGLVVGPPNNTTNPGPDMDPPKEDMPVLSMRDLPPPGIVASDGRVGWFTSLAIDARGRPHISFADRTSRALMHTYWDGRGWATSEVAAMTEMSSDSVESSLALEGEVAHIAYFAGNTLRYASLTGGQWRYLDIEEGVEGTSPSLVLDSDQVPHVAYYNSQRRELYLARWTGANWERQLIDDEGDVGRQVSLALDSTNQPHVSYYDDTNADLKYAFRRAGRWTVETVDGENRTGLYSSMVLDDSDRPHISYYAVTSKSLRYATRDAQGTWSLETVDSNPTTVVGQFTSMALDSNGVPHIAYYDLSNKDLKFAELGDETWSLRVLDGQGDVGEHLSMVLDSANRIHISYLDAAQGDLKYVTSK